MRIITGIQAILKFCLRNLRGWNVGITDGRDMMYGIMMASCGMILVKFNVDWFRDKAC
jgi:hypothetical protein